MNVKDWWRERQDLYQDDELENAIVMGLGVISSIVLAGVGYLLIKLLS